MKFLVFIVLCFVMFSAQKCKRQNDHFYRESLIGITWLHSHEENRNDTIIYRPESYSFPPSRGRTGFLLLPDGSAIYKGIGPNDVPRDNMGTWKLSEDDTHLLIIIDTKGTPTTTQRLEYIIISCQENLVQLRSVNFDSNQAK